MADFETGTIEIRYNSNAYGPFSFDFTDALFPGVTISSAVVRAFLGNVSKKDDLTDETELTTTLIETASTSVSSATVNVYFQYPGTTYLNQKATLVFELTLSNGAVHALYYQYVYIYGDES